MNSHCGGFKQYEVQVPYIVEASANLGGKVGLGNLQSLHLVEQTVPFAHEVLLSAIQRHSED